MNTKKTPYCEINNSNEVKDLKNLMKLVKFNFKTTQDQLITKLNF